MVSSRKKSAAKSKSARPAVSRKPAKKAAPVRAKSPVKKPAPAQPVALAKKPVKAVAAPKASAKAAPAAKVARTAPPKPLAAKAAAAKAAAAKAVVAKVVVAKVAPVKAAQGKHVPIVRAVAKGDIKPAHKPMKGAAAKAGIGKNRTGPSPRKGSASETVRPLGMLPPEAVARAAHQRTVQRPPLKPAPASVPVRHIAEPTRSEGAHRLTEKELKTFEDLLLRERRRILKEMGHLETTVLKVNQRDSSGDLSGYSFHMADAGTDAMEREKAFLFASVEGRVLLEIDDALRRLYRGEYGNCETCGNLIARARLEVMPQARLCISCKEKEEREQRGAV